MKNEFTNKIAIIISIIIATISSYTQSKEPQTEVTIFLGLLILIFIIFLISYPINIFKEKLNQINENTKMMQIMKEDLNSLKDKIN